MHLVTRKSECRINETVKSPKEITIDRKASPVKYCFIIKKSLYSSDSENQEFSGVTVSDDRIIAGIKNNNE